MYAATKPTQGDKQQEKVAADRSSNDFLGKGGVPGVLLQNFLCKSYF